MNLNEVISSGLLESYVLGTTTAQETALVNDLIKKHPELNKEIEAIESALINYSSQNVPSIDPAIKEKIAKELFTDKDKKTEANVISISSNSTLTYYKLAIAASLVLLISSSVYIYVLNQKVESLNGELALLSSSKSILADELKIQQASYSTLNSQFQIASDPGFKTIALKGMNSLNNNVALIHWNSETQEVYFDAKSLPASPVNKQYQLWAIVDGKPVDAGMIDITDQLVFQKMKLIKGAQAFAVTVENVGGSVSPTLDTMCLLGNV